MSIPTQLSLHGYIATTPELTKTRDGSPRFHARIGVEQFRKEPDGTFSKLDPIHCDLVAYDTTAQRAFERFRVGDSFVAAGYVNEYEVDRDGETVPRQEFVARKIGHDLARTRYEVLRRSATATEMQPTIGRKSITPAVGL